MIETQPSSFKINDIFWTFQGEGINSGRRAIFIRLPFCNLSCSWCDTEFNSFAVMAETEIKNIALSEGARLCVVTGGEPMMNKQTPRLVALMKHLGFTIAAESNGTFKPPTEIDSLTISPKRDADYEIDPDAFKMAKEFKYVVDDQFDFEILKRHKIEDGKSLFLSPEFNNMQPNLQKIFNFIKENPEWRISLQTHKWMNIA